MISISSPYVSTCIAFALLSSTALAQANTVKRELVDLSLQELANMEVTSVSKRPEPLSNAAASVFVITRNDIRRSGAATLPEALRLAPNLQVARDSASDYAISSRGFNGVLANKMLVLIDGRSVYSPLFSGAFWDTQDVVLEDIERIEVISGANTTIWGTNAVNGVINVITRNARDTQGGLATAGASDFERSGVLRYGGTLANGGHFRVYGKHAAADDSKRDNGISLDDGFRRNQAGFRADWQDADSNFSLQGDAYEGSVGSLVVPNGSSINIAGANLMSHYSKQLAEHSNISLQAYIDHTSRDHPGAFTENLTTFDIEFRHALQKARIHNIIWGVGYRISYDRVQNDNALAFLPERENLHRSNIFAQDEIALRDDLRLTLGLRLHRNNYTGGEYLPNLRLAWNPSTNHLIWGSASRAVRTPSRIDRDFFAPGNPPIVGGVPQYLIAGGDNFESEVAKTYEIGYRGQPMPSLSYSVTAFYSEYDHLRTLEPNTVGPGFVFDNQAQGITHGVEMWAKWQLMQNWRLVGGLVVQDVDYRLKSGSQDLAGNSALASNDPDYYWQLRSSWDITSQYELDVILRHVGELPQPEVDAYTSLDIRLGWEISRDLELSLVGQNLIGHEHTEYSSRIDESLFDRRLFAKLTWRFP